MICLCTWWCNNCHLWRYFFASFPRGGFYILKSLNDSTILLILDQKICWTLLIEMKTFQLLHNRLVARQTGCWMPATLSAPHCLWQKGSKSQLDWWSFFTRKCTSDLYHTQEPSQFNKFLLRVLFPTAPSDLCHNCQVIATALNKTSHCCLFWWKTYNNVFPKTKRAHSCQYWQNSLGHCLSWS